VLVGGAIALIGARGPRPGRDGAFVAHAFTTVRDPGELHPVAATVAPPAPRSPPSWPASPTTPTRARSSFAGVLVEAFHRGVAHGVARGTRRLGKKPARESLAVGGHRIVGDDVVDALEGDLRPARNRRRAGRGRAGRCEPCRRPRTVRPWASATTSTTRDEGDPSWEGRGFFLGGYAQSRLANNDRAFTRLTHDVRRRRRSSRAARTLGRKLAVRGSIVASAVAALAASRAIATRSGSSCTGSGARGARDRAVAQSPRSTSRKPCSRHCGAAWSFAPRRR